MRCFKKKIERFGLTWNYREPMISAKGYSVNANVRPEKFGLIRDLVSYLTSSEVQEKMAIQLATTPVDRSVLASPAIQNNPALVASMQQIEHGRPMPIVPQMRQIWEGMRGPYQLVMSGAITAKEAARRMQREAEKNMRTATSSCSSIGSDRTKGLHSARNSEATP